MRGKKRERKHNVHGHTHTHKTLEIREDKNSAECWSAGQPRGGEEGEAGGEEGSDAGRSACLPAACLDVGNGCRHGKA